MNPAADTIAWISSSLNDRNLAGDPTSDASDPQSQSNWALMGQIGIGMDDIGFRQSVVAVERLRTYNGRVLELTQHLVRYRRTLDFLGINICVDRETFASCIDELIKRNRAWCDQEIDFGITLLATPGDKPSNPTSIIHLNPLDHVKVERQRTIGQPLVVTAVKQPAPECWPRDIKVRCRLHYYLADRQARQFDVDGIGVLIDHDGSVTETSVANLAMVVNGEIVSPPGEQVLPGITQSLAQRIATERGINWRNQNIYPAELRSAEEVILMGTDGGIWFANRIDGQPINDQQPGEVYKHLLAGFDRYIDTPHDI
jgi:branched-chain amino acid aminotransferase